MVKMTKLNGDEIVINSAQIMIIEKIPESKVILTNKEYYLVKEPVDVIINRVIEYNAKIHDLHKTIFQKQ